MLSAKTTIKLIVGLGNPGPQYDQTRHNAGFWFVDRLIASNKIDLKFEKKFFGLAGRFKIGSSPEQEIHVLLPQNFMNLSGQAVLAYCVFYKILPDQILVAHDELDHPTGIVRLKHGGGHGGHNGLRDIISKLGSPNFNRLRIGIGRPETLQEVHNYVLAKPNNSDKQKILDAIDMAHCQLPLILAGDLQKAMNNLHNPNPK